VETLALNSLPANELICNPELMVLSKPRMTKTGKKSTGVFDSLFYPVLNNIL
jgi:hypothetical protein